MALMATAGLLTCSIGLSLIIARAALDMVFRVAGWAAPLPGTGPRVRSKS
jgi:hypothetical protein